MNDDRQQSLTRLHQRLGYKPLSRTWAKLEILLGLTAVGLGLLIGTWSVSRPAQAEWETAIAGLALFVLGGYLALAGNRSHLYQSNNELIVYVVEEIHRSSSES